MVNYENWQKVVVFLNSQRNPFKQERATLVELSRIRQIKEDEKEQKSRDLLRARERIERIVRELKQKELMLHDHKKRCLEIQLKQGKINPA